MRSAALRLTLAIIVPVVALAACSRSTSGTQAPSPAGGGAAARNAPPAAVTPANIAMGDSIFNGGSCGRCHGRGGVGGTNGPVLDGKKWVQLATGSFEEIVGIITTGVPVDKIKDPARKNPMRPRGGPMNLTDPQVQAVAAYVYTLTHK